MVLKSTPAVRRERAHRPNRYQRIRRRLGASPVLVCRRVLAAALLLAAIVLVVTPAGAAHDSMVPTAVAARDLAPGTVVHPTDLRVARIPRSERPPDALGTPQSAGDRLVAGPVRAGQPLTNSGLLSQESSRDGDQGMGTVPIRLADAGVAELLRPGTRVDVVTAEAGDVSRQILAEAATVISVTGDAAGEPTAGATAGTGPLVLIAVPRETATTVAAAALGLRVTVTLR